MAIVVLGADKRKIPTLGEDGIRDLHRRYLAAKEKTSRWHSIIRDCYDYCIPNRNNVDKADKNGQERGQKVVDGTAVEALYGFANELQSSLIPPDTAWVRMKPGVATPEESLVEAATALDHWNSVIFEDIRNSNFASAAHEALLDVAVGTGAIRVTSGDAKQRLIYEAIPLPQIVVEEGPYGSIENVYFPKTVRADMILRRWPFATLPSDLAEQVRENPAAPIDLVESSTFDTTYQCFRTVVFMERGAKAIYQAAAEESEYAVFRWAVAPGEVLGRGVAMSALPFIRTLNRAMRLTISISELAVAGMYTGVGDGVFNPHNIIFKPGAIFPVEDSDAGLKPIPQSHDFQMTQELMSEWRQRIRAIMFQEEAAPIQGNSSATAALIRADRLQQKIGGSFPRLFREMVAPIYRKTVFQLQMAGRIPPAIQLNGHDIDIQYVGPLAQASRVEDVKSVQSTLEAVAGSLGPEMVHAAFKTEEIPRFMGQGFGMPERLMRSPSEVKQMIDGAAKAVQGQAPGGAPPPAELGPEAALMPNGGTQPLPESTPSPVTPPGFGGPPPPPGV